MKPSAFKCLRELRHNEWVTTSDFLNAGCGSRFGARLHELRELGCVIEERRLPERSGSSYRLVAEPEEIPTEPGRSIGGQRAPSRRESLGDEQGGSGSGARRIRVG